MKGVLVTGAGGYIGTTLVPLLLEQGYYVKAVDRFFFGRDLLPKHPHLWRVQADTRRMDIKHFYDVAHVIDLAAVSNDPSGEQFSEATWQINHKARVRTAAMAREAGCERYILPSSCSVYGFAAPHEVCAEDSATDPLTVYAKANEAAEKCILPMASERFTVTALRQATVFGYSPRMRFNLAINGMTYGAWKTGKLPLLRDGTQWRPMLHVKDAAAAQAFMLTAPKESVNGRIFNIGSRENVFQLEPLAVQVRDALRARGRDVEIEWYGDPDTRSYNVSFDAVEALGWRATRTVTEAVNEIADMLDAGKLEKTTNTITLDRYRELARWHKEIKTLERHGGMLEIEPGAA